MVILLFTILLIFTIVKTKIIHYSSLAYFPITFLAAYGIYKIIWLTKLRPKFALIIGLGAVSLLVAVALVSVPYLATHTSLIEPYIQDDFGRAALHANVYWSGWESLIGIGYFIIFLIGILLFTQKQS